MRGLVMDSDQKSIALSTSGLPSGNPLHRFHKIPAPINFGMKSVLTDGAALINRMLDALSTIYPGMTDRITFGSRKLKRKVKATRNPTNPLRSDETSTA
jgi:hypothetical protein